MSAVKVHFHIYVDPEAYDPQGAVPENRWNEFEDAVYQAYVNLCEKYLDEESNWEVSHHKQPVSKLYTIDTDDYEDLDLAFDIEDMIDKHLWEEIESLFII
jgi:hypothetical protein